LPTTTTVTSNQNPSSFGSPVTFTATVSRGSSTTALTGTVIFKDGATQIGTAAVNLVSGAYKATLTTSSLTTGSHSITAVYSGDANFNSSTSAVLTQVVNAPPTTRRATTTQTAEGLSFNIKAWPNPTEQFFTLHIESNKHDDVIINVYDMYGKKVHSVKGLSNSNYQFGQNFKNGAYVVEVIQGADSKTMKLIKQ